MSSTEQELTHEAIEAALGLDDVVLTGWVLVWEGSKPDGGAVCGHVYGPATMTDWRALGLLEYARRVTLLDEDDDDLEADP